MHKNTSALIPFFFSGSISTSGYTSFYSSTPIQQQAAPCVLLFFCPDFRRDVVAAGASPACTAPPHLSTQRRRSRHKGVDRWLVPVRVMAIGCKGYFVPRTLHPHYN